MNGFARIAWREVRLSWTGGGLWLPIVFYLAVATLFPFVTGPDKALLSRVGGSILWIAALLASLLPIERLVLPDRQSGVLDQLVLRGWADEWIAAAKICGHIIGFGIPLLLASRREIPAVACHHGALDGGMAIKTPCFSTYLAQGKPQSAAKFKPTSVGSLVKIKPGTLTPRSRAMTGETG